MMQTTDRKEEYIIDSFHSQDINGSKYKEMKEMEMKSEDHKEEILSPANQSGMRIYNQISNIMEQEVNVNESQKEEQMHKAIKPNPLKLNAPKHHSTFDRSIDVHRSINHSQHSNSPETRAR